jgi:predicted dehydrogenase
MIRLAFIGEPALGCAIAPRLRGAAVEPSPDGCDAVALLGPAKDAPIVSFLAGGKHVLLTAEPWLSSDLLEAWSAATSAGARLAVVNPDRYLPSRQLVKEQSAGPLGAPGLLRLHRWTPAGTAWNLLRDLDLALWLVGQLPDVVYAVGQQGEPAPGDSVQVHLGFPGGGMALLDHACLPPGDGYQSLSVIGAAGAAYADDHQNVQLVYRGGRPEAIRTEEGVVALAALVQDFVDALRAGRDMPASAWRDVLRVRDAVGRSLASRQAIALEGR